MLLETVVYLVARICCISMYQFTAVSYCQAFCPLLQSDAAVYISAVLQHTVERLVAGALASCDKADFRSEASTHMDVKPRHLQVRLVFRSSTT